MYNLPLPSPPYPLPLFSSSLISPVVSVDVKHHDYLLSQGLVASNCDKNQNFSNTVDLALCFLTYMYSKSLEMRMSLTADKRSRSIQSCPETAQKACNESLIPVLFVVTEHLEIAEITPFPCAHIYSDSRLDSHYAIELISCVTNLSMSRSVS